MTNYTRIAGLVIAAVTLTTTPALAQRNRRDGGGGDRRERSQRAVPRESQRPRGGRSTRRSGATAIGAPTSFPAGPTFTTTGPMHIGRHTDTAPTATGPAGTWAFTSALPIPAYGYPGYGYGPSAGYGYYSLVPGRAYGAVRIVDAPRDAQVLVDGYYAGVVDDYDGVFQHLNLEARRTPDRDPDSRRPANLLRRSRPSRRDGDLSRIFRSLTSMRTSCPPSARQRSG